LCNGGYGNDQCKFNIGKLKVPKHIEDKIGGRKGDSQIDCPEKEDKFCEI
jgi:hypothetical protein